jgi:hypothetical protein
VRILYPRSFFFVLHFTTHAATLLPPPPFFFLFRFSVWMEGGSRRLGTTKGGYHCSRCLMICIWIWSLKICLYCLFLITSALSPSSPFSFRLGHTWDDLAVYSITYHLLSKGQGRTVKNERDLEAKEKRSKSRNNDHDPCWEAEVKLYSIPMDSSCSFITSVHLF